MKARSYCRVRKWNILPVFQRDLLLHFSRSTLKEFAGFSEILVAVIISTLCDIQNFIH